MRFTRVIRFGDNFLLASSFYVIHVQARTLDLLASSNIPHLAFVETVEPPGRKQKCCPSTSLSNEEQGEGFHLWIQAEGHVKASQLVFR